MDSNVARAMEQIRAVLAESPVPEDSGHAENTLAWLLHIDPDADTALRVAALAHDIERARPNRLKRAQFDDYDEFKAAHATMGAKIADTVLARAGIREDLRQDIGHLIRHHETGGDPRSNLIKDADSLSYFDHNLPFYYEREGWHETLRRARWGYARLSPRARRHFQVICHHQPELQEILQQCAAPA